VAAQSGPAVESGENAGIGESGHARRIAEPLHFLQGRSLFQRLDGFGSWRSGAAPGVVIRAIAHGRGNTDDCRRKRPRGAWRRRKKIFGGCGNRCVRARHHQAGDFREGFRGEKLGLPREGGNGRQPVLVRVIPWGTRRLDAGLCTLHG